jgi:hypothetical protein
MADVKYCTASPINDFEGFLHIFYCRIKNCTESLTEKLLRQVGWQGRVQNNRNLPHDVRSPNCRVLTQMYLPNFFSSRFWRAVVSFTALAIFQLYCGVIFFYISLRHLHDPKNKESGQLWNVLRVTYYEFAGPSCLVSVLKYIS